MDAIAHQSQLAPAENKFHVGNGSDGKHYWLIAAAIRSLAQEVKHEAE